MERTNNTRGGSSRDRLPVYLVGNGLVARALAGDPEALEEVGREIARRASSSLEPLSWGADGCVPGGRA